MLSTQQLQVRRHIESGLQAQATGDFATAASAYQEALRLAPEQPNALNLMGTALLQLGRAEEAVDHLHRAARQMKNNPGVHGNLGEACMDAGRYEQARDAFRKASRLEPGNVHYQIGGATALAAEGKLSDAEALLRHISRRFENEPLVWFNFGNVLRDLGRPAEALECFSTTLKLHPGHLDARNNRGGVLHALERFEEAAHDYRACIDTAPDYVLARCNLASLLIDIGRFAEAETMLRSVIALAPELIDAHIWLSATLSQQGRLSDALACLHTAVTRDPQNARAVEAQAVLLVEHGRVHEGLRAFAHLWSQTPTPALQAIRSATLLSAGRLGDGWAEYQHRPGARQFGELHPDLPLARELPSSLAGKHVCLLREQGLGDEIFFLRYARELQLRGARLTYRTNAKLCSMLSRLDFLDAVIADESPLPEADATMLIGDLPQALTALATTILSAQPDAGEPKPLPEFVEHIAAFWPAPPPSIRLEPLTDRLDQMRDRLARAGPPPYLGLTWRAGTPPHLQKGHDWVLHKSIDVAMLADAVRTFRGTVVVLQRQPEATELDRLAAALERPVHDFTAINEDLEGMLALLALIDEYVGVSNTNMHLRAAAGKAGRVLVPRPSEWRWLWTGRASPWFPGFPVYRQSYDGTWQAALGELRRDLAGIGK